MSAPTDTIKLPVSPLRQAAFSDFLKVARKLASHHSPGAGDSIAKDLYANGSAVRGGAFIAVSVLAVVQTLQRRRFFTYLEFGKTWSGFWLLHVLSHSPS